MAVALACGEDPLAVPRAAPSAGAAASLVYRAMRPDAVPLPPATAARAAFSQQHADGLLFSFPKHGHALQRDFKWTGSHRYGIVHLGAGDRDALRDTAERLSAVLGWPAPYLDQPRSATARYARPDTLLPPELQTSHLSTGADL
jgi:hypothetical protein